MFNDISIYDSMMEYLANVWQGYLSGKRGGR